MSNRQRPAKRVVFSAEDTQIVTPNGGGDARLFKEVTDEFRNSLIVNIEESLTSMISDHLVAFAMIVELEPEALAKSHRPTDIFNSTTCPFIGDIGIDVENRTGQFLIRATSEGLHRLRNRVATVSGKKPMAALSTVKSIKPYYPDISVDELQTEKEFIIRLINLEDQGTDNWVEQQFESVVAEHQAEAIRLTDNLPLYHVKLFSNNGTDKSYKFLMAIRENPIIFSVQKTRIVSILPDDLGLNNEEVISAPPPSDDREYPVVGVVDSSINDNCPYIQPWYVGEESALIDEDKDYTHGTFVAGLITNAYSLNDNRSDFPKSQSKVYSVGVLTATGGNIYEIMDMLERAQRAQPDIRVWNLSLGGDTPVSLKSISEFALLLDEFQKMYDCLCVVSAGNINEAANIRHWPPAADCPRDEQRITSPGDSVLGLTVASTAHVDGVVRTNEPSIFSRSGPVANFILKPDLCHFGGNHGYNGVDIFPLGINSLSPNQPSSSCVLSQNCGTSFSTPLVSTIAANLWQSMGYTTKRHTIKGLMAHSARLRHEIPDEHKVYFGWGSPLDVEDFMYCNENEITIVMEGEISSNTEIVGKLPFPIPDSLRTEYGKVRGEFIMTVSYDPPLDANRALEYCLVNIDTGLGEITEEGEFKGKVPAENTGFEQELMSGRYKWSPIKVYHKKFARGVDIENWKLQVKMLTREGFRPSEDFKQPFTIILTIRALDPEAQVYDEMTRLMDQYNWEVSNAIIPIEPRIEL